MTVTENGPSGTVPNGMTKKLPRLQIIDENQNFTEDLSQFMRDEWKLADSGFDYNLVAVFGSQSTGKSTLLNRLFGTDFDVMAEAARRQTTKGIWMSRGRDMPVLIMDVEGTDGRERGEDQDFERKSALFSISTSNVIIVNLWEHQVGLYNGANMGLLKTVFEVNLQLFQASRGREKTLLFFVIRDHVGSTPLANLSATVTSDLEKLWEGLAKPEGLETCQIRDYFDLAFTGLPHKLLRPDDFESEVDKLRERFVDQKDSNYVFKSTYSKRVPADGFHLYAIGIWEQIMDNKDLDLPTQQELLAQYRCDEIATVAYNAFLSNVKGFKAPIESGEIVEDLGPEMQKFRDATIRQFDKEASRYHTEVYKRKRGEILNKANAQLHAYFLGQLSNLSYQAISTFKHRILTALKSEGYDFAVVVQEAREEAEGFFQNSANAMLLSETDWSFDEDLSKLRREINEIAAKSRVEETKKMIRNLEKSFISKISEHVGLPLNKPTPEMWAEVITKYKRIYEDIETSMLKRAQSFNATEEENKESVENLKKRSWQLLRKKIDDEVADNVFMLKLRERFEEKFRYGEDGVPRVWKPEDDIDSVFRKAREQALDLIPLFATIIIPEDVELDIPSDEEMNYEESLTVFTEAKQHDLVTRFKRESDAFYLEAKRSVVSTSARIPYYMYLLLLILGWNELLSIITSPMYLVMFGFLGAIAWVVWMLNLMGPIEHFLVLISNEVMRVLGDKVVDSLENSGHTTLAQSARNILGVPTVPKDKKDD